MELLATVYRILMILFTVSLVQSQDEEMEIPCDNSLGLCLWGDLEDDGSGQLLEGFGSGGETGAESGDEFGVVAEFGCRNNILCKRQGGFCINSFSMDRQCDVLIPNLCGKRRCSCCMNCVNQASPRDCRSYGGECQITCDTDRIETGNCKGGCKCCGCRINPTCSSQNGRCITTGTPCEGTLMNDGCEGENCQCCVPVKECMRSSWCSFLGGRCVAKSECRSIINANAFMCPGIDCTCCRGRDWWCERSGGFCTHAECASGFMGRMCSDGGNCCVPMMEILDDDTAADE